MEQITELLNQYGYIVLYVALMLEMIAMPFPGEALMTYCGFLVFQGQLNWTISIFVATAGVITGMTVAYTVGSTLGNSFFMKYGKYIHITPAKIIKTSGWFDKYGNKLIPIAYFIPGIRHVTGYFSGIAKTPYSKFALFAYLGALVWTTVFISLGKVLGSNWQKFEGPVKKYLFLGVIILGSILVIVYFYRFHKIQIIDFSISVLNHSLNIFISLGRMRIAIVGAAIIFIGMLVLLTGLIQNYLGNEFVQFDTISSYLSIMVFSNEWEPVMNIIRFFTYYPVLILIAVLSFIWIFVKGKNKTLEIEFLFSTILGGEVLEETLRMLFHRLGPQELHAIPHLQYTFPSEHTLMAVVTYGFASYIVLHYVRHKWIGSLVICTAILISVTTGLSQLFFQTEYASDICTGYAFGLMWLSLNIVLMEIFRLMLKIPSIRFKTNS